MPADIYCGTGLQEDRRKIDARNRLAMAAARKIFLSENILFETIDHFHAAMAAVNGTDVFFKIRHPRKLNIKT